MNERFRELRIALGYSQQKMGEVLGLSKSGVSEIESGRRNVTEQHIIMMKNCVEFHVNETWLREGTGEMFLDVSREEELAELTKMLFMEEPDSFKNRLISALAKLKPEQWDALETVIDSISAMKPTKKE